MTAVTVPTKFDAGANVIEPLTGLTEYLPSAVSSEVALQLAGVVCPAAQSFTELTIKLTLASVVSFVRTSMTCDIPTAP
jgi:hypothetical protein